MELAPAPAPAPTFSAEERNWASSIDGARAMKIERKYLSPVRTRAKRMWRERWPRGMDSRRARARSVVGSTSSTSTLLLLLWSSCLDPDSGMLLVVGGGGGEDGRMVASVTCGWKCGKEFGMLGLGWRDISCWSSADSGSDGTSQTAMPAAQRHRF